MRIENCRLGFIGFGHMAQIICEALSKTKLIPRSQILFHRRDPAKAKENEIKYGVTSTSLGHLMDVSDVLLICVRPNQAGGVLQQIAQLNPDEKMFLSVMAGVKISFLQKHLGKRAQVARIMPNIASAVGEGMSLISFGPQPSLEFRSATTLLFGAIGQFVEISESQMDIGCAMAGSGPGFVIEMIEAMARAGEREGIAYGKALKIAAQTFLGAAHLIRQGAAPLDLLTQIATPGGTTQAGLDTLRKEECAKRFQQAVQAAAARSQQISEQY